MSTFLECVDGAVHLQALITEIVADIVNEVSREECVPSARDTEPEEDISLPSIKRRHHESINTSLHLTGYEDIIVNKDNNFALPSFNFNCAIILQRVNVEVELQKLTAKHFSTYVSLSNEDNLCETLSNSIVNPTAVLLQNMASKLKGNSCVANYNCVIVLDRIDLDTELMKLKESSKEENLLKAHVTENSYETVNTERSLCYPRRSGETFSVVNFSCFVLLNRIDICAEFKKVETVLNCKGQYQSKNINHVSLDTRLGKIDSDLNDVPKGDSDNAIVIDSHDVTDGVFRCPECPTTFTRAILLTCHSQQSHVTGKRQCPQCSYSTLNKSDLLQHLQSRHGGVSFHKTYKCDQCSKIFSMSRHLKKHKKRIHNSAMLFRCKLCDKSCKSEWHLERHHLIHKPSKMECNVCGMKFGQINSLKQHLHYHTGEPRYTCQYCQEKFNCSSTMKTHLAVHIGKNFECHHCSKRYAKKSLLQKHMVMHMEKKYACPQCPKKFTWKMVLDAHMVVHTGERNYKCQLCFSKFSQSTHLGTHMLVHTGEKKYACQHCSKRFAYKFSLESHIVVHTGAGKYKCQHCPRTFAFQSRFKKHMTVHNGERAERKFECQLCSKKFIQSTHLRDHMVVHTREKKYVCQHCSKCFVHESSLKYHMVVHTGGAKYKCQHCPKSFAKQSHFERHASAHSDEKKYVCQLCSKCFAFKSSLKIHMVKHTGEGMISCPYCPKSFPIQSRVKRHLETVHNNEWNSQATRHATT